MLMKVRKVVSVALLTDDEDEDEDEDIRSRQSNIDNNEV